MVIVMLIMAVLLLAGTTFMTISSTESQIARNEQASAQAFTLAEAAIHKALVQLDANPGYTGETNTLLGDGRFTVTVGTAPAGEQRCPGATAMALVATASVPVGGGTAQVQIRATADQVSYPYRWAAFAAVPNQVVSSVLGVDRSESELWLKEHTTTDSFDSTLGTYSPSTNSGTGGNIGANGSIRLDSTVSVKGSVRAGDNLQASPDVTVTGGQATSLSPSSTSPGESFPSVTGPAPSGSRTFSAGANTLEAGTYSYTSLTVEDGATITPSGPVTIYVSGGVTLGDNVTLGGETHPTDLRMILKSDGSNSDSADFTAGQNSRFYGSIYGKNTNIQLGHGAQIFGSIIGRTILLDDHSAAHFDQAMLNQEICTGGRYAILRGSWREVIP